MPNQATLAEIEIAELTQTVDDGRAPTDAFKLLPSLRTLLDTRLADLKTKDAATLTTEGGRAGAQVALRTDAHVRRPPGPDGGVRTPGGVSSRLPSARVDVHDAATQ